MSQPADQKDTVSQGSGRHSRQMEASEKQKRTERSHDSGQDDADEPGKPSIIEEVPKPAQETPVVKPQPKVQENASEKDDDSSPTKPNMPARDKKNKSKAVKAQKLNQPYLENTKMNKSARAGAVTKKKGKLDKPKKSVPESSATKIENQSKVESPDKVRQAI